MYWGPAQQAELQVDACAGKYIEEGYEKKMIHVHYIPVGVYIHVCTHVCYIYIYTYTTLHTKQLA